MGKRPRRDSFSRFAAVDDEVLAFIARNLARKRSLRSVAVALLHASHLNQERIAEVLDVDQATVSRGLASFFDAFHRLSGGSSVVDTEERKE